MKEEPEDCPAEGRYIFVIVVINEMRSSID